MENITDFKKCKKVLQIDFNNINDINKLLEYKVILIDSFNYSFRFDEFATTKESIERGFIVPVIDSSATGFIAKEPYMSVNIPKAIQEINARLDYLYYQSDLIKFLNYVDKYKSDLYEVDKLKVDYEKNEIMNLEELGRNVSIELANIMFELDFSHWTYFRCDSFEEYKNHLKDIIDNDRDIEDVLEQHNITREEIIIKIDEAKENIEPIRDFKIKDFYCKFSKPINERIELNVYIEEEDNFTKVNTLYIRNTNIDEIKEFVSDVMCKEIGKILDDGTIEKEYYRQGYVYKNYENFYKREGICYVAEGDEGTIEEAGISFDGIYEEVCSYLMLSGVDITKVPINEIERMIDEVFEQIDWQYVCSLLEGDNYLDDYIEDFPKEYFISQKSEESESR